MSGWSSPPNPGSPPPAGSPPPGWGGASAPPAPPPGWGSPPAPTAAPNTGWSPPPGAAPPPAPPPAWSPPAPPAPPAPSNWAPPTAPAPAPTAPPVYPQPNQPQSFAPPPPASAGDQFAGWGFDPAEAARRAQQSSQESDKRKSQDDVLKKLAEGDTDFRVLPLPRGHRLAQKGLASLLIKMHKAPFMSKLWDEICLCQTWPEKYRDLPCPFCRLLDEVGKRVDVYGQLSKPMHAFNAVVRPNSASLSAAERTRDVQKVMLVQPSIWDPIEQSYPVLGDYTHPAFGVDFRARRIGKDKSTKYEVMPDGLFDRGTLVQLRRSPIYRDAQGNPDVPRIMDTLNRVKDLDVFFDLSTEDRQAQTMHAEKWRRYFESGGQPQQEASWGPPPGGAGWGAAPAGPAPGWAAPGAPGQQTFGGPPGGPPLNQPPYQPPPGQQGWPQGGPPPQGQPPYQPQPYQPPTWGGPPQGAGGPGAPGVPAPAGWKQDERGNWGH